MSPYLVAYQTYHREPPGIPWVDAIDFHLQHGFVYSSPTAFLLARPVRWDAPDSEHLELAPHTNPDPHAWHIWAAAGDLREIIQIGLRVRAELLSYQRRNHRLHRVTLDALARA